MIRLSLFRKQAKGFVDHLQPAAMLNEHVMVLKSGALMTAFAYAGKDAESATAFEINRTAQLSNNVLSRLGSGWCSYHDAVRRKTDSYLPQVHAFPDPVSQSIEDERREFYEGLGTPYETYYVMSLVWMPPSERAGKIGEMMVSTDGSNSGTTIADRHLIQFENTVENIAHQLSTVVDTRQLGEIHSVAEDGRTVVTHELLEFVSYCISGTHHPIVLPERPIYLDSVIGGHDFHGGMPPMVGEHYVQTVAIEGFPTESYPTILAGLDELPINYRWSNRFIYLDGTEAASELGKYRKKWEQKVRGFKDQIYNEQKGPVNRDADNMTNDADQAISEASSGLVAFGYFTSVVVIYATDSDEVERWAKEVRRMINNRGFVARIESINANESFIGSIPGHIDYNVRRPLISTDNLSDIIPLNAIWAGMLYNPCPFYAPSSPALMQVSARGSTSFRLNLHIGDVGHAAILGPTGAGKSVLLSVLMAQSLRYPKAQIYAFDKGLSAYALCRGVGGNHYDIGSDEQPLCFQPLGLIDSDSYLGWASEWIESLVTLQGLILGPEKRKAIYTALIQLRSSPTRSLTEFSASVQDMEIREALEPYTISGPLGELLDAEKDDFTSSNFSVFEIEELMDRGDKYLLPVITYLFKRIEMQLDGRPTFLVIDEAWIVLQHPVFREKIKEWLKVLRKANCAVVLATQSLSDLTKSGIADVIMESCLTKILLPNPIAGAEVSRPFYQDLMGLNEAQIEIISLATQKLHYYYTSPLGNRLFDLSLGPAALKYCAVSGRAAKAAIDAQYTFSQGDTSCLISA